MDRGITRRFFNTALVGVAGAPRAGAPAFAQEDDLLAQIKKRGYMRVGTFSIPPEAWIDIGTGERRGIDADFTRAIADSIGVEVDPVVLVHAALAPALEGNRVDVIAGLYRTPEREKVMAYNEVPFWYGIDVVVANREGGIDKLDELKGKVIGTVRGSAQEVEAEELKTRYGIADIRKFDSADPMLLALKAGRLTLPSGGATPSTTPCRRTPPTISRWSSTWRPNIWAPTSCRRPTTSSPGPGRNR